LIFRDIKSNDDTNSLNCSHFSFTIPERLAPKEVVIAGTMVLDIHYHCPPGKVPTLEVADTSSPLYGLVDLTQWKMPLPPNIQRLLHPEMISLAQSGTGRPDKMMNLLLRYYNTYVSDREMYTITMLTATWVGNLDRNQAEEERYFAEAFPVLCIGGVLKIKVKRTPSI
jgi:hypothetical protein